MMKHQKPREESTRHHLRKILCTSIVLYLPLSLHLMTASAYAVSYNFSVVDASTGTPYLTAMFDSDVTDNWSWRLGNITNVMFTWHAPVSATGADVQR